MQQNDDDLRVAAEELFQEQARSREQIRYMEVRSRQFLRAGIVTSTALIAIVATVFAFVQQGGRQAEVNRLLQTEIASQSQVIRLLSVPLLHSRFDSLQTVTANDTRRLDNSITALDGRLDVILLTAFTVIVGSITAFLAPFFTSLAQRRGGAKSATDAPLGGNPNATY